MSIFRRKIPEATAIEVFNTACIQAAKGEWERIKSNLDIFHSSSQIPFADDNWCVYQLALCIMAMDLNTLHRVFDDTDAQHIFQSVCLKITDGDDMRFFHALKDYSIAFKQDTQENRKVLSKMGVTFLSRVQVGVSKEEAEKNRDNFLLASMISMMLLTQHVFYWHEINKQNKIILESNNIPTQFDFTSF